MYVYDRWAPVKLLLSFAVIAFLAGFSIQGYRDMPENAPVLFNAQTAAYTARRCLNLHPEDANWIGYITVKDARTFGYHADPKCADAGGFSQDARSLSGALLEYLGILGPLPSRWEANGAWKW